MKKLFLPPGAKVVADRVVLSNGVEVPKWALVAVPTVKLKPRPKDSGTERSRTTEYVDVVTGASSPTRPTTRRVNARGKSEAGDYDFTNFSRYLSREDYNRLVVDSLPSRPEPDPVLGTDPGYFEQLDARPRPVTEVDEFTGTPTPETELSDGYVLRDALIWEGRPQELTGQRSTTAASIVTNMRHVAVNVLERVDEENAYTPGYDVVLPHRVRTWFVEESYFTPDDESYTGQAVRIEFDADRDLVYKKAVDMATKLSFDRMYLDFRSDGRTLITVVAPEGEVRRRIATRYDDVVISEGRFICASGGVNVEEDQVRTDRDADDDVLPDPDDDYYPFYVAVRDNPQVFGGVAQAQSLLRRLGFPTNPTLSGRAGFSPTAGTAATTASKESMNQVSDVIQCPQVKSDPKVFPTSSHAALRTLGDLTQLDDGKTQDTIPFSLRANNPLKVKSIKGVTDLRDRFGYVGEAEGIAVYRDHVGGAAAGLAYLMQMQGSTVGAAAKSILGKGASAGDGSDITATSLAKAMQGIGQSLFGIPDPTGSVQECAVVKGDDMESLISTAAAMSASLAELDRSPLTHSEWASAYQIAKNEPNEHLKKSTTGFDLPVTERDETKVQPTGSRTPTQGKEKPGTTDQTKSASEKWNPVGNYAHYSSNVWGPSGSNWISTGLVSYQQKQDETDKVRIAKITDSEELSQDPKTYTTSTNLDWA